jgi:DNA polymerase (family 10)
MYKINKELARIFEEMASYYRFTGEKDRFRVIAYENAARVVDHLTEDIRNFSKEELIDIHGIGEGIATKIREYIETGRIKKFEELRKNIPADFVDLLNVQGIGPKTLQTLHRELGVKSRDELMKATKSGKFEKLKGFGTKTVQNIKEGLAEVQKSKKRIYLADALDIVDYLWDQLNECKEIQQLEFAGSIRRMKPTIGDIDILATAKAGDRKKVLDYFVSMDDTKKVLAHGDTKASIIIDLENIQVDLRLVNPDEWGAALLYFTGSKDHNVHLRTIAKDKNWKINEYGLYNNETDKKLAGKTEEEMYEKLGLNWIPPELREDRGEIKQAANQALPNLIEEHDIHGDFHLHSNWSEGQPEIEELAQHVFEHYSYDYLILTDHSKSSRIAGGLTEEEILDQRNTIEEVNKSLGADFLKAGAEVDILRDGSMDYDDGILAKLDWVTASVHSLFNQDNTDRILKAIENPFVCAISHPAGLLVNVKSIR